eukprot:754594-Hanusia_phi.AAC.5
MVERDIKRLEAALKTFFLEEARISEVSERGVRMEQVRMTFSRYRRRCMHESSSRSNLKLNFRSNRCEHIEDGEAGVDAQADSQSLSSWHGTSSFVIVFCEQTKDKSATERDKDFMAKLNTVDDIDSLIEEPFFEDVVGARRWTRMNSQQEQGIASFSSPPNFEISIFDAINDVVVKTKSNQEFIDDAPYLQTMLAANVKVLHQIFHFYSKHTHMMKMIDDDVIATAELVRTKDFLTQQEFLDMAKDCGFLTSANKLDEKKIRENVFAAQLEEIQKEFEVEEVKSERRRRQHVDDQQEKMIADDDFLKVFDDEDESLCLKAGLGWNARAGKLACKAVIRLLESIFTEMEVKEVVEVNRLKDPRQHCIQRAGDGDGDGDEDVDDDVVRGGWIFETPPLLNSISS